MGFVLNIASIQKWKPMLGLIMKKISPKYITVCPSWISLAVLGPSAPEEDVAEYSSFREEQKVQSEA